MHVTIKSLGIDQLSLAERILLVEELWDSIAMEAESLDIPQSHKGRTRPPTRSLSCRSKCRFELGKKSKLACRNHRRPPDDHPGPKRRSIWATREIGMNSNVTGSGQTFFFASKKRSNASIACRRFTGLSTETSGVR